MRFKDDEISVTQEIVSEVVSTSRDRFLDCRLTQQGAVVKALRSCKYILEGIILIDGDACGREGGTTRSKLKL